MKKLNLLIAILFSINSIAISQIKTHQCTVEANMLPQEDPSRSVYVPYGGVHTPKGNLHGLIIFVGFNNIDPNNGFHGDIYEWDHNDIPNWAKGADNEIFNSTSATIGNNLNISSFFKTMSNPSAPFLFTADVFPEQIMLTAPQPFDHTTINSQVFQYISNNYPSFNWGKYDNRTNNPNYNSDNSISTPDNKIDYINIVYRKDNGYQGYNGIFGSHSVTTNYGGTSKTYQITSGHTAISSGSNPVSFATFFFHEFGHSLYGAPHIWGANGVVGNRFHTGIGWGMTGHVTNFSANAWERWYLGWIELTTGTLQVNSDIQSKADLTATNGVFTLRDFVTTGDVIRIKIPHLQNQYLWLENRTGITDYDNRRGYTTDGDGDPIPSAPHGLIMFIENTSDSRATTTSVFKPGAANSTRIINGSGNFNYTHSTEPTQPNFWWQNYVFNFNESQANPFGHHHSGAVIRSDFYTPVTNGVVFSTKDNIIQNSNYVNGLPGGALGNEMYEVLMESGNKIYGGMLSNISIPLNKKIGISSNPAITGMQTYSTLDNSMSPIYIHGLSIKVVHYQYQDKSLGIEIKYDDLNVDENTTWCGNNIILPENPENPYPGYVDLNYPALTIKSNKVLTIDKTGTPNRHIALSPGDFFNPTVFTCQPGAYFKMENNSSVNVDNGSTFILQSGSKLEVGFGSSFNVRNGSKFIIEEGAEIIVHDGGKILIDGNESEIHYSASSIWLLTSNSILEINKGKLFVAANTDFTFEGEGFIRFFCDGDSRVIGGLGSRFLINGTGKNDKKIEIMEGPLKMTLEHSHPYLSKGFPITITNAGVHLAEGAKMLANVWLNLQNTKFTSTTGAKNGHGGLHVSVDENHIINNVTFEYGQYGMYSVLHANHVHSNYAEKINISNCVFSNNTIGLVTVGQGANLENVQFINNSLKGWSAEGMTMPSDFKNSSVQNSPIGISYSAGTTADLFINTSSVLNSTNTGILFLGNALLSLKCSNINSVNNNSSKGIFLGDRASINMSPSFFPSSGRSIVSGNTSIQGGQYALVEEELSVGRLNLIGAANELFLDQGRNDIRPKTSQGKAISGQFYYNSCPEGSIMANRNRWNIGNTSPVYSVDYNINSPSCKNTIYIIDNQPGNLPCPLVATPSPASAFFYRANEIAEANQGGPNTIFKKFERGLNNLEISDYLSAFNEFESVLLTNVPNPTPLAKKVIELSYRYIHYAAGKAYSAGEINNSGTSMNQYAIRLIAIEENKINEAIVNSDTATEYLAKMDKAKTLVLADRRIDALPIFYSNYAIADSTNIVELDSWICVISREQELIDEVIELEEFAETLYTCQTQSLVSNRMNNKDDKENTEGNEITGTKNPGIAEGLENINNPSEKTNTNYNTLTNNPSFKFYPNPTNGRFTIESNSIHNVKIYDLLGNLIVEFIPNSDNSQLEIDFTGNAKGIYVVKVTGENFSEIKKLIHQ